MFCATNKVIATQSVLERIAAARALVQAKMLKNVVSGVKKRMAKYSPSSLKLRLYWANPMQ
jgi:hypothetical protein